VFKRQRREQYNTSFVVRVLIVFFVFAIVSPDSNNTELAHKVFGIILPCTSKGLVLGESGNLSKKCMFIFIILCFAVASAQGYFS